MSNEENYIIENETTNSTKKQEYWNTGIGLNKVDNLEPSKYLLELSKKNINGELKYYEVESLLKTYYETQDANSINIQREKECDLVSLRIAQLLEDKISISIYLKIHMILQVIIEIIILLKKRKF